MQSRQEHIALFSDYEDPTVNITTVVTCADFVAKAKAHNVPPFAALLFAIAEASLAVENFRWRLDGGEAVEVTHLKTGHTVLDKNNNLNFSAIEHTNDFDIFVRRYIKDREIVHAATSLRLSEREDRDHLYVTCTPWLFFTAFEHPVARFGDASIPNIAVGQFKFEDGMVRFPLAVQAHHGLVDGLHIHQLIETITDGVGALF
ncbi:MAG: hypothetical protein GXP06_10590 [Alphaproteobacteria bacterium]|nr:hypothetical protein [Alphaproteobacteria bacterium]